MEPFFIFIFIVVLLKNMELQKADQITVLDFFFFQGEDEEEEEDLVDPLDGMKEACGNTSHCAALNERLSTCNDRLTQSLFKKLK
ncbi:putative mitochondrial ubiquinol-cytochrome c reductase complex 11 kDa protein-like [Homarus americanus]|uniref:Putative mitochondrial ubiquinol-cytochrome c reductase complex 11 kDa protein-like n=1 Tax=Homarus americanus TaxID=6706 RepID=A0A8J5J6W3_HOMAM|nr:putative mitochondrial ubiquinol-cytochrome c reductase complex 11 kDa protein-like [Homarus americanus]